MGGHNIHLVKRLCAVRALSHAVGDSIFDAVVTEEVTAGLEDRVLEVLAADGAKCESLDRSVSKFSVTLRWRLTLSISSSPD